MHILYLHQHFTTPRGAGGTRSYEMARRLLAADHKVTVVCGSYRGGDTGLDGPFYGGRREGDVDGIKVVEFDLNYSNTDGFLKRSRTFFRYALGATRIALRGGYDVLFATTTPLTVGIPGIAGRWLRRKPFVFEVRDLWPELPKAMGVITNPLVLWGMGLLEFLSYHSAHRCIALSPGIRDGIARLGVPLERIELVPNGADLEVFSAGQKEKWRPTGVSQTDLMAVFAGTHGLANGLESVLDASSELKRRGRADIKLVLIGDGKLKPQLMARAQDEGLANVIFHDPVPKERVAGLLAAADVGLQILANIPAFYYGTSPNKFFDYAAAGLPVVNNYPGWLCELIKENDCGYAVAPGDPVAFADALEQAADHREELKRMGQRARTLAEREFDRDRLGTLWIDWVTGTAEKRT